MGFHLHREPVQEIEQLAGELGVEIPWDKE